jgi:hypothetical protein
MPDTGFIWLPSPGLTRIDREDPEACHRETSAAFWQLPPPSQWIAKSRAITVLATWAVSRPGLFYTHARRLSRAAGGVFGPR